MNNNFDTNSKGLSIKSTLHLDCDASRQDFGDSFTKLDDGLYLYTEYEKLSSEVDMTDIIKIKGRKKDIMKVLERGYQILYCSYDIEREEVVSNLILNSFSNGNINIRCLDDFNNDHAEYNISASLNPNFLIMETRGYCQGDYAQVLINKKDFTKTTGRSFTKKCIVELQKKIDNLFWDAPVGGNITINDIEILDEEFIDDYYNWDKPQAIQNLLKLSDFKEFDKKALQEQLELVLEETITD